MKLGMKAIRLAVLGAALLLFGLGDAATGQTTRTESSSAPVQTQMPNPQADQMTDLRALGLKPEQIQRIREINFELKDQRQAAGIKLRQAQRALTEAIESPTPNESLIEQRSREVAEAQANTIRLRSLTEARILQVLSPEQRERLKEIRQRNMALRRERQQQAPNGLDQRQQGLQRNVNAPALNPAQRRALRRQQKP